MDGNQSFLAIKRLAEEFRYAIHSSLRLSQQFTVTYTQRADLGPPGKSTAYTIKLFGVGLQKLLLIQGRSAKMFARQHGILRSDNLIQIAFHENNLIMLVCGKMGQ